MILFAQRGKANAIQCGRCHNTIGEVVSGPADMDVSEVGGPITGSVRMSVFVRPSPGYLPDDDGVWRPTQRSRLATVHARAMRSNPVAKFGRTAPRLIGIPELPARQECVRCRHENVLDAGRLHLG